MVMRMVGPDRRLVKDARRTLVLGAKTILS